jgi:hypothetical protein
MNAILNSYTCVQEEKVVYAPHRPVVIPVYSDGILLSANGLPTMKPMMREPKTLEKKNGTIRSPAPRRVVLLTASGCIS